MRNSLTKIGLALGAFFVFNGNLMAQGVYLSASTQELAYVGKVYKGMAGSPFLYEDWTSGKVKLTDGTTYEGLKLMYDLVKDELIFSIEENKAQKFMHPIKEFTLQETKGLTLGNERLYRNGFPAIDGSSEQNFYEVLSDGNTKLLKRTYKAIVEERTPTSRVATKQLKATEKLYLYKDGTMEKLRKDKKSILKALDNKSAEVEKFMQQKKVNPKTEEGLAEIVAYYNTL